jgi:predicted metalloprotease with PDZ domain
MSIPLNLARRTVVALSALMALLATSPIARADYPGFAATLTEPGGVIELSAPNRLAVSPDEVKAWVQRAATALTHFYGKYPVKHVSVFVLSAAEGAVQGGVEYGGRRIEIHLGSDTTHSDLLADWMITHEMFHLSQPELDDDYSWMSEGMADYLEPVARVRIGQITPRRFWRDLVEGMPQGLPRPGDRGLDHTHTWGRTYWGGSLYWLLADIRVRQQTHNQKSVRDAARAALDAGGDGSQYWTINHLLDVYDKGVGVTVFKDLHDELGEKPGAIDLDALWKSLGVIYDGRDVTFDDSAPLADIRRGIVAPEK